jgi:hypothetical protein
MREEREYLAHYRSFLELAREQMQNNQVSAHILTVVSMYTHRPSLLELIHVV